MIYNQYIQLFFATLSIVIMGTGSHALAAQDLPGTLNNDFDILFNEEQSLNDEELDALRGGFLTSNGMVIDFAFSTSTLVDGQLINQVVLNSADTVATRATSLRNIIQIGEGNSAFSSTVNLNALPNILTIVQNNLDDLTIQQINLLDISIENFDNYIQQSVAPEIDFQNTFRLMH